MVVRRIIAVSPDKAVGKTLAGALKAAGGSVESFADVAELPAGELAADLVVLHLADPLATTGAAAADAVVARLPADAKLIAILPTADLIAMVDVLQLSARVAGVLVADDLLPRALTAMSTRALAGDLFGLDKVVPWGTRIQSQLVADYASRTACVAEVSRFAESVGVRKKFRDAIDACCEEMLMNALYDAPVDDEGRPLFADVTGKARIAMAADHQVAHNVVVQYAFDGSAFALSVRDAFGTLDRGTVVSYLHKCLHAEQQIDRKAGGAGLGLYLMASSATAMMFNVLPGIATEATCVFGLDSAKPKLAELGFFTEKIDAAGKLAVAEPPKLPPGVSFPVERRAATVVQAAPTRVVALGLAAAIGAIVALCAAIAYPRLTAPAHASVEIDTVPADVTIELNGRVVGNAANGKLVLDDLEVGRTYPVTARHAGYDSRDVTIEPQKGGVTTTITLTAQPAASLSITSAPAGANVTIDGNPAGTTPLAVTLPQRHGAKLTLSLRGYRDATIQVVDPVAGKPTPIVAQLALADELARVHVTSDPPGASVSRNGDPLVGVTTPCDVLVDADTPQTFVLTMPGRLPVTIARVMAAHSDDKVTVHAELKPAIDLAVDATIPAKVTIVGVPTCAARATPATCQLAAGTYKVELVGNDPTTGALARATRTLTVADGDTPQLHFAFGIVAAPAGKLIAAGTGAGKPKLVLEAGKRMLTLIDGGSSRQIVVTVRPGGTTVAE